MATEKDTLPVNRLGRKNKFQYPEIWKILTLNGVPKSAYTLFHYLPIMSKILKIPNNSAEKG